MRTWAAGLSGSGSMHQNGHTDLVCDLGPAQVLVTKLQDLLCRGGMSGRAAATHGDAGPAKLIAHRGP